MSDLHVTDPTMDLGNRILHLLAEGYDGEQTTVRLGITAERAKEALAAYAARVIDGTAPAHPSPDCGSRNSYNGWCYRHGVFHPEAS